MKISDASGGAAYKTAAGFGEPYGDYGEIAITNDRQDDRRLGRGPELPRTRRRLGEPADLNRPTRPA